MNAKYKKIIFLLLLLAGCAATSLLSSDKEEPAPAASFSRAGVQSAGDKRSGKAQGSAGRVRINSASASELQSLPGVGPALAQRIIAERSRGRFASTEDLLRVSGIGKAKLEKMRAYVEVD